ncbi:MAG: response regulator [Desulfobacterales bacterium]|nr:response regulator [Desulfobacterales bacterium]
MTEKQKVLVVDDEKNICDNVKKILAKNNYEVELAQSGQEALEKMSKEPFALMLSDMVMPGMNGLELLKQVKNEWPLTKALIMTAYGSTDTAVKAMQLGALDYITKPFTPDELRNVINLAASEKLAEAPTPEEVKQQINVIDLDMPFDADEVAKYTGEDYVSTLSRSDRPVVEVKKPESYCEMGQMVCDIFKKMGKTCKAGMKTQECPQKKAKKAKSAKTAKAPSVKKLVGIDMPFNYDEVMALTGPEYVSNLHSGEIAFMPYEQLKAQMAGTTGRKEARTSRKEARTGSDQPFDMDEVSKYTGEEYTKTLGSSDMPVVEVKKSENYCEMGQMACDIFKKLGKTCKAGMKTQECPQKKAKKGKAAKKSRGPAIKTLIGVDMPFDYEEVAALTGAEYASNVDRSGYAVAPYEELKARVQAMMEENKAQPDAEVIEFPAQAAGENVLVIDDEPYISKNVKKILAKKGYAVQQAVTRDEALDQLGAGSYDLVLLDLKIPGVKGLELLESVRQKQPQAKVVIITGYASIESAKESARMGIYDYLHKPFTPEELRKTAEAAISLAA